jgi:hypothetical protein
VYMQYMCTCLTRKKIWQLFLEAVMYMYMCDNKSSFIEINGWVHTHFNNNIKGTNIYM